MQDQEKEVGGVGQRPNTTPLQFAKVISVVDEMISDAISRPELINRLVEAIYEKLPPRQVEASLHICDTFVVDPDKRYIINIPGSDTENQKYIEEIHKALKDFGMVNCLIVTGGIEILEAYDPASESKDEE